MKSAVKVWIIIAVCLILIGLIIFGCIMAMLEWDFAKLSTVKYETNTYEIIEDFDNISISTDTAQVIFLPSEDSSAKVICYEEENSKHSVTVKDGKLIIEIVDTRKWFNFVGISVGNSPKLTVYLPKSEYASLTVNGSTGGVDIPNDFKLGTIDVSLSTGYVRCQASTAGLLKIRTSTGDINIEGVSAEMLDLSVSTGKVTLRKAACNGDIKIKVSTGNAVLTDVECKTLASSGSTGRITLTNVIASGRISIERDTGNVIFDRCDAAEIFVETDTGSVKGSLLSEKIFITQTDTGSVRVPSSTSGGRCEITTDTGDINIEIVS